jgi:DeoR/GlpR family transcriptional regulator of sugar metabolism
MLTEGSRSAIVNLQNGNGKITFNDLGMRFVTIESTMRTGLKELHRSGLAFKTFGGAVRRSSTDK